MRGFSIIAVSAFLAVAGFAPVSAQVEGVDITANASRLFAEHCYEPNQRGGRALEPVSGAAWEFVAGEFRERLGIPDDPAVKAWFRPGASTDEFILLQIHERRLDRAGVHSGQLRISCRVVAVSPKVQAETLRERVAQIVGSPPGGTRGDTLERLGYPTPEGWDQACWTILERIEDTDWQGDTYDGRPRCFSLTTPRNYTVSQYIVIRLLTRNDGGTAILEFDRTLPPDALKDD